MHGRHLLAVKFGVIVLVKQEQLHDPSREARDAAQLPGIDRIDNVDDLGSWDANDVTSKARVRHVARMPPVEVIRHASPDLVELDPLADDIAGGRHLIAVERQHLGGEHLQLQGNHQPVLGPPWPEPEEHFPGDEHLAGRPPLQPVEIGEALGIGLIGPVEPQLLDIGLERCISNQ